MLCKVKRHTCNNQPFLPKQEPFHVSHWNPILMLMIVLSAGFGCTSDHPEETPPPETTNDLTNVLFILDASEPKDAAEAQAFQEVKVALSNVLKTVEDMNVGLMVFSGDAASASSQDVALFPVRPLQSTGFETQLLNLVSAPDDDVMVPVDGSAVLPDGTTLRFDDGIEAVTHGFTFGQPSDYIEDGVVGPCCRFATLGFETIGMRFADISIPQGAKILSARLTGEASSDYGPAQVAIVIEDSGDARTFQPGEELTQRTTRGEVAWSLKYGDDGAQIVSPDLSVLIQQVVDRSDWQMGNAMAFQFLPLSGQKSLCLPHRLNSCTSPTLEVAWVQPRDITQRYNIELQFHRVQLPPNARIKSAYLEIQAALNSTSLAVLTLSGGVGSNDMASTHVQWDTYRRWKTGRAYSSPDIAPLIEEIAASPDWCLSETIRLQLSQTTEGGNLSMMSFEGNPFFSPKLHIEFEPDPLGPFCRVEQNDAANPGWITLEEMTSKDVMTEALNALIPHGQWSPEGALAEAALYFNGAVAELGSLRGVPLEAENATTSLDIREQGVHPETADCDGLDSFPERCVLESRKAPLVYTSPFEAFGAENTHIVLISRGEASTHESHFTEVASRVLGGPCVDANGESECGQRLAARLVTQDQNPVKEGIRRVWTHGLSLSGYDRDMDDIVDAGGGFYFISNPGQIEGTLSALLKEIKGVQADRLTSPLLTYEITPQGENRFRFDFTLHNNLGYDIDVFYIWFDMDGYDDLAVVSEPEGWDVRVSQPDMFWSWDGIFGGLALREPIAAGESLAGFSVSATRISASPEALALRMEILDDKSFKTLEIEEFVPEF